MIWPWVLSGVNRWITIQAMEGFSHAIDRAESRVARWLEKVLHLIRRARPVVTVVGIKNPRTEWVARLAGRAGLLHASSKWKPKRSVRRSI